MQSISIGRFDKDPSAQGVIRPEDDSWQLVIDKDGFPHLYVWAKLEKVTPEDPEGGFICIEDFMGGDLKIRDLMQGTFGGKLTPKEEEDAYKEWCEEREKTGIPCPR